MSREKTLMLYHLHEQAGTKQCYAVGFVCVFILFGNDDHTRQSLVGALCFFFFTHAHSLPYTPSSAQPHSFSMADAQGSSTVKKGKH